MNPRGGGQPREPYLEALVRVGRHSSRRLTAPLLAPSGRSALGCSEARRPCRSAPPMLIFRNAMQRSPKAMPLSPTRVDLPECHCHLPTIKSAGRWSRPVYHLHANIRPPPSSSAGSWPPALLSLRRLRLLPALARPRGAPRGGCRDDRTEILYLAS